MLADDVGLYVSREWIAVWKHTAKREEARRRGRVLRRTRCADSQRVPADFDGARVGVDRPEEADL
jgi:hypothetical protein